MEDLIGDHLCTLCNCKHLIPETTTAIAVYMGIISDYISYGFLGCSVKTFSFHSVGRQHLTITCDQRYQHSCDKQECFREGHSLQIQGKPPVLQLSTHQRQHDPLRHAAHICLCFMVSHHL